MKQHEHLTDEQLARYRNRTADPVELLDLDQRVSGCADCRDRLSDRQHVPARIAALRAEIAGHLEYTRIVACSEGMTSPEQWQHLQDCGPCRSDVQDLSRFRTELRAPRAPAVKPPSPLTRWLVLAGIAALVLLIAGAGIVTLRGRKPAPTPAPAATASVAPAPADLSLPPAERQTFALAVSSLRFERAPILNELIVPPAGKPGAQAGAPHFELLGPIGTAVITDRPVMRWMPLEGATSYVVSVFAEHVQKLVESPALTATDWRPDQPLPRGRVLNWQVTARFRGAAVRAPAANAPEARFEIAAQDVVDGIAAIRRDHPGNPLLLAALLAKAGALDEAELELNGMDSSTAQPYRESIARLRKPD